MTPMPRWYDWRMAPVRKPRATYAELEALPDDVVGEIVDGELWASPRPRTRHGHVAFELGSDLRDPFGRGRDGPGGWVFLPEPELHLEEDVLVPDLAGWRVERWRPQGDEVGIETVPDWACEILSPSTARLDRVHKMDAYARAGLGHLWLIDPALRTVEAYRASEGKWLRFGTWADDASARIEPFEATELLIAGWWL